MASPERVVPLASVGIVIAIWVSVSSSGCFILSAQKMVSCGSHAPKIQGAIKLLSKKKNQTSNPAGQLDLKELHTVPWGSASSDCSGLGKGDHKVKGFCRLYRFAGPYCRWRMI